MTKFIFLVVALVLLVSFGQASAQKRKKISNPKKTEAVVTSLDVKIKEDKFSGKREVSLAKQTIASDLTLELSGTVDLDAPAKTAQQSSSSYVDIKFTFDYGSGGYTGFEGSPLNFVVDGKRVEGGNLSYSEGDLSAQLSKKEFLLGSITVGSLEKIANGSEVQMKLGIKVREIDASVRKNIKAFVAALKRK